MNCLVFVNVKPLSGSQYEVVTTNLLNSKKSHFCMAMSTSREMCVQSVVVGQAKRLYRLDVLPAPVH